GVRPVVVRAGETIGFTFGLVTNSCTAVTASVDEGIEVTLAVTIDDYRLVPHIRCFERTCFWDFTFVCNPNPGFIENPFHFRLENVWVGVKLAGDTVIFNQRSIISCGILRNSHFSPKMWCIKLRRRLE